MLTPKEISEFEIDPVIKFCYDFILPISDDRVLATHGAEISLITKAGDLICTYDSIEVPFYDDREDTFYSEDSKSLVSRKKYIEDMLLFKDGEFWGLLDYDGEILADAHYTSIKFVGENEIVVNYI